MKSKALSIEKARKEAVTDGLKRALKSFGNALGNCLNDMNYLKCIARAPKPQPEPEDVNNLKHSFEDPNIQKNRYITPKPPLSASSDIHIANGASNCEGFPQPNAQASRRSCNSLQTPQQCHQKALVRSASEYPALNTDTKIQNGGLPVTPSGGKSTEEDMKALIKNVDSKVANIEVEQPRCESPAPEEAVRMERKLKQKLKQQEFLEKQKKRQASFQGDAGDVNTPALKPDPAHAQVPLPVDASAAIQPAGFFEDCDLWNETIAMEELESAVTHVEQSHTKPTMPEASSNLAANCSASNSRGQQTRASSYRNFEVSHPFQSKKRRMDPP